MPAATADRPRRASRGARARTRVTWPVLVLSAVAIAVVDAIVEHGFPEKLWVAGLLDETAHTGTALIALGCIGYAFDRWFLAGALMGAVLIDADHVPTHLGWDGLEMAHTREFTHSLGTVAAFALLALLFRGRPRLLAGGLATGVALHLFRDLSEPANDSPGVPLLWPLSDAGAKVPYEVYAAVVAALLIGALARRIWWWRRRRGPDGGS